MTGVQAGPARNQGFQHAVVCWILVRNEGYSGKELTTPDGPSAGGHLALIPQPCHSMEPTLAERDRLLDDDQLPRKAGAVTVVDPPPEKKRGASDKRTGRRR